MASSLSWRGIFSRMLPFCEWLPELRQWSTVKADLLAGLTVAMLFIPQSMAYAHLAGVPVHMGLYAAFIPPIVAALFGSSRYLSTGPVPVTSLLAAVAMMSFAVSGTQEYIQYMLLLTCLAGIIQLTLGLLRFGVVVNFLSFPVMLGFVNAVALIIASMQLSSLLGVSAITQPHYYQTLWQVLRDGWFSAHVPSVMMAGITFIIILGGRRLWPKLPHILIAVVVTACLAWFFDYEKVVIVRPNQIINAPIQESLLNYQHYPLEMQTLLQAVRSTSQKVPEVIKRFGANTEEADKAIYQANQAKWQLERRISRHNVETGELSRLRLGRIVTTHHQDVFVVGQQMAPIDHIKTQQWRIAHLPTKTTPLMLQAGGDVVGYVPQGLPHFKAIVWDWNAVSQLFMAALVIGLVGFTEAITIAKRISAQSRQRLNINQELIGQGLAKCIGSFFQSMPVSGSFTRSIINFNAGAKTGFSSIVAGLIVMVVLLWFTPLFYYVPYATLAAVIMVGVLGLLDVKEMYRVWRVSRYEGMVSLLTCLLTLFLAPHLATALILGMLLSLGVYLYETMRPRFSELAYSVEGGWIECNENEDPKNCELIRVVRFGGSLYFANVSYFEEKILKLITANRKLRYIVLDCVGINKIDASGLETLHNLCISLSEAGIQLGFTRMRLPVLTLLKKGGLFEQVGDKHFYKSNADAIADIFKRLGKAHHHKCSLSDVTSDH